MCIYLYEMYVYICIHICLCAWNTCIYVYTHMLSLYKSICKYSLSGILYRLENDLKYS